MSVSVSHHCMVLLLVELLQCYHKCMDAEASFPSSPVDWAILLGPIAAGLVVIVVGLVLCCICCAYRKRHSERQQTRNTRSLAGQQCESTSSGRPTVQGLSSLSLLSHQQSSLSLTPHTPGPVIRPRQVESCIYVQPNSNTMVNDGSTPTSSWCMETKHTEQTNGEGSRPGHYPMDEFTTSLENKPPWLFKNLARTQAEYLLTAHGTAGCYMVRTVADGSTNICLSVLAPKGGPKFRHLLVVKTEASLHRIGSLPVESEAFETLSQLLEFYSKHEIHFHDSGPSVTLTKPCIPSSY